MPRHVDAQEKILSQIIVCSSVLNVPGVFRYTEYVFEVYFGVPRQVDVQEKILSQIIVCYSVLTVFEGFSNA